jgi:hypothetical protein
VFVKTLPREIAARWIKPGDEVAMYEVEDGSGEADSGKRGFCRTEAYVSQYASVEWWVVIDGARLVPPPADKRVGRIEGSVRHWLGGLFGIEPMDRGFVPDDLDHIGAHSFAIAPIRGRELGAPRVCFASEAEQFVIREKVKVPVIKAGPNDFRLLNPRERTEGQRVSAGSTVAEPTPGIGEVTEQLPSGRIPMGVMGASLGRLVKESAAVDFHSRRDSDEATMGTGNVARDDEESLNFADEGF